MNKPITKSASIHIRVPEALKASLLLAVDKHHKETGIQITLSQYLVSKLSEIFKRKS